MAVAVGVDPLHIHVTVTILVLDGGVQLAVVVRVEGCLVYAAVVVVILQVGVDDTILVGVVVNGINLAVFIAINHLGVGETVAVSVYGVGVGLTVSVAVDGPHHPSRCVGPIHIGQVDHAAVGQVAIGVFAGHFVLPFGVLSCSVVNGILRLPELFPGGQKNFRHRDHQHNHGRRWSVIVGCVTKVGSSFITTIPTKSLWSQKPNAPP